MNFFRTTDTTDTTIWKPGFTIKRRLLVSKVIIAMGCYSEYASPLQEILRRCKQ